MKLKKTSPVTAEGTEVQAPAKKKGNKVINVIINVILVVAIVLAAFCTYISFVNNQKSSAPSIFGIIPLSVQTDSMEPTLSQGDLVIDKAVKDAEKYAEEDKKRQEVVEEKNRLDSTIIQMETLVRENGDKFDSNDKAKLEEEIKKAKEALEKGDPESVRRASEELTNNTAPIIQKMYQQTQGGQQGPQGGAQEGSSDGVDYDIKDAD